MKTKFTLLMAFCLILSSCIKDFYAHPDDKNGILTETNYFYSEDFKTEFLQIQIAKLDEEIKELIAGGADATDSKLILVKQKREEVSNAVTAIASYREAVYKRRPPIPGPCPKDQNCYPNLQYLAVPPGLAFYELLVFDANGSVIGKTEGNPVALDNVGGLLDYVVFKFDNPDYQGAIQIQVKEKLNSGDAISEFVLDSKIGQ